MSSFDSLPQWIQECDMHNLSKRIPRIMVGNKCDLTSKITVNTNMAQKFADSHSMPLFETSAKDDSKSNHVDAIFMTLAHKLRNSKPLMPSIWQEPEHRSKVITMSRIDDTEEKETGCPC